MGSSQQPRGRPIRSGSPTSCIVTAGGLLHLIWGNGVNDQIVGPAASVTPAWRSDSLAVAYVSPTGSAMLDTVGRAGATAAQHPCRLRSPADHRARLRAGLDNARRSHQHVSRDPDRHPAPQPGDAASTRVRSRPTCGGSPPPTCFFDLSRQRSTDPYRNQSSPCRRQRNIDRPWRHPRRRQLARRSAHRDRSPPRRAPADPDRRAATARYDLPSSAPFTNSASPRRPAASCASAGRESTCGRPACMAGSAVCAALVLIATGCIGITNTVGSTTSSSPSSASLTPAAGQGCGRRLIFTGSAGLEDAFIDDTIRRNAVRKRGQSPLASPGRQRPTAARPSGGDCRPAVCWS